MMKLLDGIFSKTKKQKKNLQNLKNCLKKQKIYEFGIEKMQISQLLDEKLL